MLSVIYESFMLMGCLGFWLLPRNLICSVPENWVFMKINETEKSAEIRDPVNKSKSKHIITQLTKILSKFI